MQTRQLKFRAFYNNCPWKFEQTEVGGYLQFVANSYEYSFSLPFITEGWTVSQYVGMLDDENTEIYEGDIIGFGHKEDGKWVSGPHSVFALNDLEDLYMNECHPLNNAMSDRFILGNVFQNPELVSKFNLTTNK